MTWSKKFSYREVKNGVVTDTVLYISAIEEGRYTIAQANAQLDEKGAFTGELIPVRKMVKLV